MGQVNGTLARGRMSLVAVFLALCGSSPAMGHGEADWISAGNYKDRNGTHCCSVGTDCLPVAYGEVVRIVGGWKHVPTGTVLADGDPGIHENKDPRARTFRCVRGGEFKCYFPGLET